jgi:hypothetical protein
MTPQNANVRDVVVAPSVPSPPPDGAARTHRLLAETEEVRWLGLEESREEDISHYIYMYIYNIITIFVD